MPVFEHGNAERDLQQGRNIVDAAKAADVQHLVWSYVSHAGYFARR